MLSNNDFEYLVLSIVSEIPKGSVSSYGQIAKLAGYPKNARKVGKVLSHAEIFGEFPCHRVIHSDGSLVAGWLQQAELLIAEGVEVKNSRVNMKKYQWKHK